nr:MAG TPA: hypothetical protein [Caudoviricetes sp.]
MRASDFVDKKTIRVRRVKLNNAVFHFNFVTTFIDGEASVWLQNKIRAVGDIFVLDRIVNFVSHTQSLLALLISVGRFLTNDAADMPNLDETLRLVQINRISVVDFNKRCAIHDPQIAKPWIQIDVAVLITDTLMLVTFCHDYTSNAQTSHWSATQAFHFVAHIREAVAQEILDVA